MNVGSGDQNAGNIRVGALRVEGGIAICEVAPKIKHSSQDGRAVSSRSGQCQVLPASVHCTAQHLQVAKAPLNGCACFSRRREERFVVNTMPHGRAHHMHVPPAASKSVRRRAPIHTCSTCGALMTEFSTHD
jgi:hypothetical protein